MALSVAPRVKFCASVSNRMTTRASSVSPRDATSRNGSVPTTGYPTTVVSTAANVSSSVSTATTFCSGHSDGHPAVPVSSSEHATMVLTSPASSNTAHTRLRKPYTPSFDVKAVNDGHDHGVDRPVLRRRGEPRRASGRVKNYFAEPCAYAVHCDHVAPLATEIRREILDNEQLQRGERRILPRRYHGAHDAPELHWWCVSAAGVNGCGRSVARFHFASVPCLV